MSDSPSPPPAPDYAGAAQQTAAGNLEAARVAAKANRVNQYTPYGNLIYTQGGGRTFDQTAYDAAQKNFNENAFDPNSDSSGSYMGGPPNKDDYYKTSGDPDSWSSRIELSPTGKKLLDYSDAAQLGLGEQTTQALGRVNDSLSQPFDQTSVTDIYNKAYDTQTARLDPQFEHSQARTENQLVNQGLRPGTEAYDNAMRNFNVGKNDAYSQARMNAINTMPQSFQLASAARNQPLNELNALRTGAQVTNPAFNNSIPQQQTTAGANMAQAVGQQGQYDQGLYNSQVATSNQQNQQLGTLAAGAAMMFF